MIEGALDLHAVFNGEERRDVFQVRIVAPSDYPDSMPLLLEMGGRTAAIAAKYRIADLRDLHRNPANGSACVCVKQDERHRFPKGANLWHFIDQLAVPYLFGLSHFDEHGKWPWPDYSHGVLGIVEYYAEAADDPSAGTLGETLDFIRQDYSWRDFRKQIRQPSPMRMCVCGSQRPISLCHKGVWAGIVKLNSDIQRFGLNARRVLQR